MTPQRKAAIKQRDAQKTPEQIARDKKNANDFYNDFMKKEHYDWRNELNEGAFPYLLLAVTQVKFYLPLQLVLVRLEL